MTNTSQETIREINQLVDAGYNRLKSERLRTEDTIATCDNWLQAWERAKQLATPEMRTYDDFDVAYPASKFPLANWLADLEMHLHNAGLKDPRYFEERLHFAREQIVLFPDMDDNATVNTRRAEGEALWLLGRQAEAEAVYQALVEQLPDQAWGYIGWADQYYMWRDQFMWFALPSLSIWRLSRPIYPIRLSGNRTGELAKEMTDEMFTLRRHS
jgi:hypothetical protein